MRACWTAWMAVALAVGWGCREAQFASAQAKKVSDGTQNAAEVKMQDAEFEGKATGKVGFYLDGSTDGLKSLHSGRFLLAPGAQPHPPHRHADEEVLIVSRGQGEVYCAGKTTPVKAGAIMFAGANTEHGIKNTGQTPLEFYWVKWVPQK